LSFCCRDQLTSQIRDLQNDLINDRKKRLANRHYPREMSNDSANFGELHVGSIKQARLAAVAAHPKHSVTITGSFSNIEVLIFATRAGGNCIQRSTACCRGAPRI
jgi:hypothetical protein